MKKRNALRSPIPLILLLCGYVFLIISLSSCELQSLIANRDPNLTSLAPTGGTTVPVGEVTTAPPTVTTAQPAITTEVTTAQTLPTATTAPLTTPTSPSSVCHPLTGHQTTIEVASKRPVAFCVKRAEGSLIASADIVVEAPTEGAATRLSLIGCELYTSYREEALASTRPYLAAITHDFFGISVYRGTSDNNHPSADFLYDTVDLTACSSITNADALQDTIRKKGYQTTVVGSILLPFLFAEEGCVAVPADYTASYISVAFGDTVATSFTYDSVRSLYTMRSSSAIVPDGTSPIFSNILILFHDATRRVTKDGTELTLDTEIGGQGYLLTGGGMMPIFWRRDPVTSSLRFTATDGTPLVINRGKTYIGMTTYEERDRLIMN